MNKKTISFVLPVYNEVEGITEFHRVLSDTIEILEKKYNFDLIFVNDGSSDGSDMILRKIAEKDLRVKVVEFSRNFGHQIAVTAGLDFAVGDAVVIMDTDLQDPPSICLELVHEWENGTEVAYAVRKTRRDGLFKRMTAWIFYKVMSVLSDYPIPENTGDFRLLDSKAAEAMRKYREKSRFVRGIAAHIGFRQKAVFFDRDERMAGATHYPFKKMLKFSTDAIFSFSEVPLRLMSKIGYLLFGSSILGIIYIIILKLFYSEITVQGWPFTIVTLFFVSGLQFVMLGTIGEYVGRIYAESKGRPLYIVSSIYGKK